MGAYLVDMWIVWLLVFLIPLGLRALAGSHLLSFSNIPFWLAVAYYLQKDALPNGQSIGKRFFGLAVIDARTYQNCKWWQSALRNLMLVLLFPLEVIITLFCKRRTGDALASTMVIDAKVEAEEKG